ATNCDSSDFSDSSYLCAQCIQPLVDALISPVDLINILNGAFSLGRKCRNQQGDTCPYIWRHHVDTPKRHLPVESDDYRTMRIAENNLCAHFYQFVDKEQAAFKHFLMNEHCAL